MGISLHPVSGASPQYIAPAVKVSSDSTPATTPQAQAQVTIPSVATTPSSNSSSVGSEIQSQDALVEAAISFKNVYAISDQSFSIFKDATGKYITRYVSLRDGKVTYLPEPTLVKQLQLSGGSSSRIAISV